MTASEGVDTCGALQAWENAQACCPVGWDGLGGLTNEEFCHFRSRTLCLTDGSQSPKFGFDLWKSSEELNKFKKTDVSDNISLDILTLDLQVKLDKDQGFIFKEAWMPAQNFLQSSQPESIISLTLSPDYLTSVFRERYAHNWFIENMLLGLYVSTEPSRLLFTKDGQSDISTSGKQLFFFVVVFFYPQQIYKKKCKIQESLIFFFFNITICGGKSLGSVVICNKRSWLRSLDVLLTKRPL